MTVQGRRGKGGQAKTYLRNMNFKYVQSYINSEYTDVQSGYYLSYEVLPGKCRQQEVALLGYWVSSQERTL